MTTQNDVINWLCHMDSHDDCTPAQTQAQWSTGIGKRKRHLGQTLSQHENGAFLSKQYCKSEGDLPMSKRKRVCDGFCEDHHEEDAQKETWEVVEAFKSRQSTPQHSTSSTQKVQLQHQLHIQPTSISSMSSSCNKSSSFGKSSSAMSCPTKKLVDLEIGPEALEKRVLPKEDPLFPKALADLMFELDQCNKGVGVVSRSRKNKIEKQTLTGGVSLKFPDNAYTDPEARDKLGVTPSAQDAVHIVNEAAECFYCDLPEPAWNQSVHWPLLSKAIYDSGRQKQLVGVVPCPSALIFKEYLPANFLSRKIDYRIFLAPDNVPSSEKMKPAVEAIKTLRGVLPCRSINHIDFAPLRIRPIVIHVETNIPDRTLKEADIQVGTSHVAHWKLLSRSVSYANGTRETLPFLPAIVVRGHVWSFVATTRENQKTIMWGKQIFGSTEDVLGVYKVIWGLQRIARWAEEVYWPWYKENVLGLHGPDQLQESSSTVS